MKKGRWPGKKALPTGRGDGMQLIVPLQACPDVGKGRRHGSRRKHSPKAWNIRMLLHPISELRAFTVEEQKRYRVYMGHIRLHGKILSGIDPIYVTMGRHSVERVISYYHHVMTLNPKWFNRNESLLKFVDQATDGQTSNLHTRLLSDKVNRVSMERQFSAAVENLNRKFAFVGLTERFGASVRSICSDLSLPLRTQS